MNNDLSEREIEIIVLVADGFNYKEIADKLFLSPDTVSAHKKNILKKTKAKNAANLIKIAYLKGLI